MKVSWNIRTSSTGYSYKDLQGRSEAAGAEGTGLLPIFTGLIKKSHVTQQAVMWAISTTAFTIQQETGLIKYSPEMSNIIIQKTEFSTPTVIYKERLHFNYPSVPVREEVNETLPYQCWAAASSMPLKLLLQKRMLNGASWRGQWQGSYAVFEGAPLWLFRCLWCSGSHSIRMSWAEGSEVRSCALRGSESVQWNSISAFLGNRVDQNRLGTGCPLRLWMPCP